MVERNKVQVTVAALGLCLAWMAPIGAQAQTQSAMSAVKWEASIYGWVPAIGMSTVIHDQAGPDINLSKEQVLENLKMAFFGTLEARMGRYGLFTDLVYSDLGKTQYTERDIDIAGPANAVITGQVDLDVKATLWTVAGTYNLVSTPGHSADLVFGARLNDMNNTVDYDLAVKVGPAQGTRVGTIKDMESYWDGIVGFKGRAHLGAERKWFIPYYVDVGTGQSKLTWQAQAGVGYELGWGAVIATWRYVSYEFKADSALQTVDFGGPTIGMAFRF